ncbi:NADPH:quinone oxidoreductase family protein [Rhodobacter calidifons]|uniref:NADPH:quinone oxidoreductase family protein n=1 Tax=Rhodobacter calidifons TaxID=2715277 RepID=A0ABX0GB10_9RHOB|nr:NADPH:quinone oxidoreductase family protein [Rhodobacter calidifons]NHB78278.1 NADPH:quinone oxidoreductase family protein [Rhodobacter calidifons]
MQAWQVSELGAAPELVSIASPVPVKGEVVVRVEAVGLNFADMLSIQGKYQVRHPFPYIPGMELSGVVEALGPDTEAPAPGTRVLSTCPAGALAERVALPAARLFALPDAMGFEEAAGFPIAYGTSHLALTHTARLRPGETLFVTGAAGGVGLTAVEIGKRLGARVIASARGADRLEVARAAGADLLIDSEAPGLKEALRAAGGVDVVYDAVGGPAFDAALRACRPEGRLLAIGFASGEVPQIPANLLLVRNLTVSGFWYGGMEAHVPAVAAASMAELLRWRAEGLLRPHVSHVLPFAAFPEGLDLLRTRRATGKVVIRVGQQQ